jgi:hypothetical protein
MPTEIALHHIGESHRTCCIDLVGGMRTADRWQEKMKLPAVPQRDERSQLLG